MGASPTRSQSWLSCVWSSCWRDQLRLDTTGSLRCPETTASRGRSDSSEVQVLFVFCFDHFFFPCVCVNLDFAPGAFAALGEARRWFKLGVLRATVIERRMVVGAGWSPWRHPDPSPCLSAHSDKWLHTGQMGLLSPTHSSLDARGTGQHSSPPITPPPASI